MRLRHLLALLCVISSACAEVRVVAHRGASASQLENTIQAIDLAWEQGADAVELDFRMTQDGHIVCIHDADTERVSGKKLVVADTDLAVLQELALRPDMNTGESPKIPLMSEALQHIPADKFAYLEIKSGVETVSPFLKVIRESALDPSQIMLISFNQEVLKALAVEAPEYKTSLLVSLKFRGLGLRPKASTIFKQAADCQVDGISIKAHPMLAVDFGNRAKALGYEFHVWTIDSPKRGVEMAQQGAQSITTNRPDIIKPALRSITQSQ
ncbi:MAG: glycerophosphodiester phosphodiesterase family protein [Opitutaceae bacterium]